MKIGLEESLAFTTEDMLLLLLNINKSALKHLPVFCWQQWHKQYVIFKILLHRVWSRSMRSCTRMSETSWRPSTLARWATLDYETFILGISQNKYFDHISVNDPGLQISCNGNPRLCHQYWWTILWMKIERYSDLRFRYQDLSIDFHRFNLAVLCLHICSETCEFAYLKKKHLGFFLAGLKLAKNFFYSAGGLNSGATLATSWSLILANQTWMWPGKCSARFVSLSIVKIKI